MSYIILFTGFLILVIISYISLNNSKGKKKSNLIIRFKRGFKSRYFQKKKNKEKVSNSLMSDPEINIIIGVQQAIDQKEADDNARQMARSNMKLPGM